MLCLGVAGEVLECAPHSQHEIRSGDTLILYGEQQMIAALGQRPAGAEGEQAHEKAVEMHEEKLRQQEAKERVQADGPSGLTAP